MSSSAMPKIIYFGMFGPLSRLPFAALCQAGADLRAVIVPPREAGPARAAAPSVRALLPPADRIPRPPTSAALLGRTIVDLAWERGLPALEVARFDAAALAALGRYAPDLLVVSCFPLRFPVALLALPPLGTLNLHPALLPRGRGPDPLFWAFRASDPAQAGAGGITAHLMAGGLDSGPIIMQDRVPLSDGMSGGELELQLAARGAALLTEAVAAVTTGTAQPRPQDEALATSFPPPTLADFTLTTTSSARWAFNFLRGTAGAGVPHTLVVGARRWHILMARGYEPAATLAAPFLEDDAGETLRVRCVPGVLEVVARSLT